MNRFSVAFMQIIKIVISITNEVFASFYFAKILILLPFQSREFCNMGFNNNFLKKIVS